MAGGKQYIYRVMRHYENQMDDTTPELEERAAFGTLKEAEKAARRDLKDEDWGDEFFESYTERVGRNGLLEIYAQCIDAQIFQVYVEKKEATPQLLKALGIPLERPKSIPAAKGQSTKSGSPKLYVILHNTYEFDTSSERDDANFFCGTEIVTRTVYDSLYRANLAAYEYFAQQLAENDEEFDSDDESGSEEIQGYSELKNRGSKSSPFYGCTEGFEGDGDRDPGGYFEVQVVELNASFDRFIDGGDSKEKKKRSTASTSRQKKS